MASKYGNNIFNVPDAITYQNLALTLVYSHCYTEYLMNYNPKNEQPKLILPDDIKIWSKDYATHIKDKLSEIFNGSFALYDSKDFTQKLNEIKSKLENKLDLPESIESKMFCHISDDFWTSIPKEICCEKVKAILCYANRAAHNYIIRSQMSMGMTSEIEIPADIRENEEVMKWAMQYAYYMIDFHLNIYKNMFQNKIDF